MSIPDFIQWVENSLDQQADSPASAEVIRTGLQPQVDVEDSIKSKEDHDQIMALDSHIQRMKEVARRSRLRGGQGKKIQSLIQQFADVWDEIINSNPDESDADGLGNENPSQDQLNYMKDNQPLPEPPRSGDAIPGGKPAI